MMRSCCWLGPGQEYSRCRHDRLGDNVEMPKIEFVRKFWSIKIFSFVARESCECAGQAPVAISAQRVKLPRCG